MSSSTSKGKHNKRVLWCHQTVKKLPSACNKTAFFCWFEAFKGRIQLILLHSKLQCSTAVKRTLPSWNLVDYSSQEIHFCGQKTGIKSASPSGRHRPRNQSSKKDYTITNLSFPVATICFGRESLAWVLASAMPEEDSVSYRSTGFEPSAPPPAAVDHYDFHHHQDNSSSYDGDSFQDDKVFD